MKNLNNFIFYTLFLMQVNFILLNNKIEDISDEKLNYYKRMSKSEADWLWSQQLPNGAFAFYNHFNGEVSVNPYFSEIVAISLINYDNSVLCKEKIEKYFEWHFSHLNNKTYDINNLEGTIYDYKYIIKNGEIIEEITEKKYDSTDSYAALFLKALGDYSKNIGIDNTKDYIINKSSLINKIVNVILSTMIYDYSYAKPNYKIIYLMDNCEVYSGLKAAEYLYSNIIKNETELLLLIKNKIIYFDNNFDKEWWKGDHYASILNKDKTEYTHIQFSYDQFYPSATSQLFPFIYELISPFSNEHSNIVYNKLNEYWKWEEMDYFKNNNSSFYWGNFALFASIFKDQQKLDIYLKEYQKIVDNGRKYPLYSSESGMILLGLNKMIDYINIERDNIKNEEKQYYQNNNIFVIILVIIIVLLISGLGIFFYLKRKKKKESIESFLIN